MALYLSASTGETQQKVSHSNDFTVHALRRDVDGMLHYTNARSTEDPATYDFHRTDGEEYTDFTPVSYTHLTLPTICSV